MSLWRTTAAAACGFGLAAVPVPGTSQEYSVVETGVSSQSPLRVPVPATFPNTPAVDPDRAIAASPHSPPAPSPDEGSAAGPAGGLKLPSLRRIVSALTTDFETPRAPAGPDAEPVEDGPLEPAEETDLELTVAEAFPSDEAEPAVAVAALAPPTVPGAAERSPLAGPSRPLAGLTARPPQVSIDPPPPQVLATRPVALAGVSPAAAPAIASPAARFGPLAPPPQAMIDPEVEVLPTSPVALAGVAPAAAPAPNAVRLAVGALTAAPPAADLSPALAAIGPPPAAAAPADPALNGRMAASNAAAYARETSASADYAAAQERYRASLATAAAAQREYEAEIARWRESVKACRAGDYDRCGE